MQKMLLPTVAVALVVASCGKQPSSQPENRSDTFGVEIPHYSLSEFRRLPPFQAKVVQKSKWSLPDALSGKTNFLVAITFEREGGQRLAVSANPASEDLLKMLESIYEDRTYLMPDALK